jgi:hypothetical protein
MLISEYRNQSILGPKMERDVGSTRRPKEQTSTGITSKILWY